MTVVAALALASVIAGAGSFQGEPASAPVGEPWVKGCVGQEQVFRGAGRARLENALRRLPPAERKRIQARLERIDLLTAAWRTAQKTALVRSVVMSMVPLSRGAFAPPPEMSTFLRMNGLELPKRKVIGRKGRMMI